MKICMVLPHFHPYVGGAEKMFYDLAKGLIARGHSLRVVTQDTGTGRSGRCRIRCAGDVFMDVWYCHWPEFFGHPLPNAADIEPHIRWADVVHTSTFTPSPPVSRLCRKYGKPGILTVHEVHGFKWYWVDSPLRATAFLLYEWYVCTRPFSMVHAVSEATKRDFFSFCGKRDVRRVYLANEMNPDMERDPDFDLYKYFGVPRDKRIFLYYGRPGKTKGVNVYEQALLELCRRGTDLSGVRFCFALGAEPAGPRREFLKSIRENDLEELVKTAPSLSRPALAACIAQADYVVVPSVTEGFGLSALEACQMGKKLIVSDAGSLPEVVYGQLCPFKNRNARDLADQLERVIREGDSAFITVKEKQFTYSAMIGGIEGLYLELLERKERAMKRKAAGKEGGR